jgi:Rieske 2Fe-2S family protein
VAVAIDPPDVPRQWRLGPDRVPKGRYLDPEFLALELERLFPATWLMACRLEEVVEPGRFVELAVGDESVVVVRVDETTVRAWFNSCRHRGTRLLSGRGRVGEIRCPFHAWRWDLDGRLAHRPDEVGFAPRPVAELCLVECRSDVWAGFVFVDLDGRAEPLADYLAPLPERLEGFRLEDMGTTWHKRIRLPAN